MRNLELNRRRMLASGTAIVAGGVATSPWAMAASRDEPRPADVRGSFVLGLNTSTLRGHKLTIAEEVEIAAQAGFRGLEPWVEELERHAASGKSLEDLGKRIGDLGILVESAIGFFEWIVDDPARRKKALETARRNMEMVAKIGGKRLAAPPVGATNEALGDLRRAAERYRELLELGDRMGVVPQVEVWGFSRTLGTLGEAALVAMEANHPSACILPDVYHLYKGGSSLQGLKLLSHNAIHVFHFNDYPADPPRERINDADRVYPGDGIAPLGSVLGDLDEGGFHVMLSLELFNRRYWEQDPRQVARTGYEKMKGLVDRLKA